MDKFKIGAASTTFALAILFRSIFTYGYPDVLPFGLGLVDALIVFAGALTLVLSAHQFIIGKYPDTAEMLPLFSSIFWTTIIASYVILRYQPNYQTSLSIMVTGVFVGMGWWIQAITNAANSRRTHTLNIIMASRTSSEYQMQTQKMSKVFRGSAIAPELAEWRFNPNKEEFKTIDVPQHIDEAINGTVYALNYFEFLAQGIEFRDLDDRLLRECFKSILAGLEKRAFHLIIEAQKLDTEAFEGVIRLAKDWNNESVVERYRSNPANASIGPLKPSGPEIQRILNGPDCDKPDADNVSPIRPEADVTS